PRARGPPHGVRSRPGRSGRRDGALGAAMTDASSRPGGEEPMEVDEHVGPEPEPMEVDEPPAPPSAPAPTAAGTILAVGFTQPAQVLRAYPIG
ncbi:hypothetical protein EG878_16655, partial [Enterococcus faecalis]